MTTNTWNALYMVHVDKVFIFKLSLLDFVYFPNDTLSIGMQNPTHSLLILSWQVF